MDAERMVEKAERDTGYALREPWRSVAVRFVGQHGLTSPGLYRLFDTLMLLDREAGLLPPAEDPVEALAREARKR